jgi:hypothetical protein
MGEPGASARSDARLAEPAVKLADLREVKHPKHDKRVCVACKSFVAECHAPVGDGSAPMCWLCAHHVVDHDVPVHEAMTAQCECAPEDVYPMRVLQARGLAYVHGDVDYTKERHPKDWMSGHFFNAATGCTDSNWRGEVVASMPIMPPAPKRRR